VCHHHHHQQQQQLYNPGWALASLMHSVYNVRTVQHEHYMCEQVEAPIFLFIVNIAVAKTLKK
jgi:hypothetical protein